MSRVALYRRQSLDKSGDELGIARQLKECQRVAKARGLTDYEVITDNDITASKRGRPGYNRLIRMVSDGEIDTIIILRVDRLLRLNDELEELIQLVETRGLKVITCEGDIDLSTPQGRLIARILVSVARSEMEVKGARHKLANQQRAEKGLPHAGGRRAFGYNADGLTINEDEALVLKEIAHRFLSGHSYNEIVYWLNRSGYKTAYGNVFYVIAVRQLLMRKRYKGVREHNGVEYPAAWPAIFDEDTWLRIQAEIRRRSESLGDAPRSRKFLLTGLLYCGECGHPMNGSNARDHRTRELRYIYRCRSQSRTGVGEAGCGRVSRGCIPLEWWIRELICHRLDTPALGELLKPGDTSTADLLKQKAAHEARLTELLDDYTDGLLSRTEYARAKKRVQTQLDVVMSGIERLHYTRTVGGLVEAGQSVRERWETETDGWRRQLIELLIERIEINASRKLPRVEIEGKTFYFNSEAVSVVWRV